MRICLKGELIMKRNQWIKIGLPALALLGLMVLTTTVLASTPITGDLCGASKRGGEKGPNGLLLKKDVFCEKSSTWTWDIFKEADQSSLTLEPGQSFPVNYTVTATATEEGNFNVSGHIYVMNTTNAPIVINSVTDSLGAVQCGVNFPYTLPAQWLLQCTYSGSLGSEPSENVATAVDAAGVSASVKAPIDWSKAAITSETDECIDVSDTFAGALGTVCAGDETSFTFEYTRDVSFEVCGEYDVDNTASFETNDTGASGSSDVTIPVDVPCEPDGGCTLTPGYWKTHSTYGPAPYDDTWAEIGEDTDFFFSGKSYYEALHTAPEGNAYYILAHAYIAAELNQLNGANFSAAQYAFDQATALFNDPANTPEAIGALEGEARGIWIDLAETLDDYNNGLIGPGHCTE